MQMLKKLLNSDSKYFLELDETKDSEAVQTTVKTAKQTTKVVQEKAADVVESEPVQEVVKTADEVVETGKEKAASALSESSPATATENKSSQKKSTKKSTSKDKASKNGKVAKTPQSAGASSYEPPFWVAAMSNTNNGKINSNGQMTEATFADDNLMPTITKYRRRPGGSLAKFKEMAKTAKTPRK